MYLKYALTSIYWYSPLLYTYSQSQLWRVYSGCPTYFNYFLNNIEWIHKNKEIFKILLTSKTKLVCKILHLSNIWCSFLVPFLVPFTIFKLFKSNTPVEEWLFKFLGNKNVIAHYYRVSLSLFLPFSIVTKVILFFYFYYVCNPEVLFVSKSAIYYLYCLLFTHTCLVSFRVCLLQPLHSL